MKNSRKLAIVFGAVFMLAFAGCGDEKAVVEITPTPVPTATPTAVPPTVTPAPTATPAPRVIGVKTSQSKFIYLTNSLGTDLREIHLRASGTEEWGNNLIPIESIVKSGEQVQMYYTSEGSSTDTSADTSANSSLYDVKVVTEEGNAYEIYSVDTEDMEQATLTMDQENGVAYLRYMSLSTNSEADTRDNSQQTGYGSDTSDDSADSYYDDSSDSYYDDSSDDYYDDSSDGYYDDSSDDYYDDSSDDYYDDSSDDYYDDSSDDYYDDSSDDYYDDSYDDSYVDAGDDDGYYDDSDDYYDDSSDGYYDDSEDIPWDYE